MASLHAPHPISHSSNYLETSNTAWQRLSSVSELMSILFVLCEQSVLKEKCKSGRAGLYCLMRVCRRWRDVAISTPRLWDNIPLIYSGKRGEDAIDRFSSFLKCFLERSHACPLSVVFISYGSYDATPNNCERRLLPSLVELLLPQAYRLASIDIASDTLDELAPVLRKLRQLSTTARRLHTVEISCGSQTPASFDPLPDDMLIDLSQARNLQHVCLIGKDQDYYNTPHEPFFLQVPSSLRSLSGIGSRFEILPNSADPPNDFRHLFLRDTPSSLSNMIQLRALLPSLVSLYLDFQFYNDIQHITQGVSISLPMLERLFLSYHAVPILGMLSTPQLVRIRLDYKRLDINDPSIINFIRRSGCQHTLRNFSIYTSDVTEVEIIDILTELPELDTLGLYILEITDLLLAALTIPPGSDPEGSSSGSDDICDHEESSPEAESSVSDSTWAEAEVGSEKHPVLGLCPKLTLLMLLPESKDYETNMSVGAAESLILSRRPNEQREFGNSLQFVMLPMVGGDLVSVASNPYVEEMTWLEIRSGLRPYIQSAMEENDFLDEWERGDQDI